MEFVLDRNEEREEPATSHEQWCVFPALSLRMVWLLATVATTMKCRPQPDDLMVHPSAFDFLQSKTIIQANAVLTGAAAIAPLYPISPMKFGRLDDTGTEIYFTKFCNRGNRLLFDKRYTILRLIRVGGISFALMRSSGQEIYQTRKTLKTTKFI